LTELEDLVIEPRASWPGSPPISPTSKIRQVADVSGPR
jgi:hypothetical protein